MAAPRREPTPEELEALGSCSNEEMLRRFGVYSRTVARWRREYQRPHIPPRRVITVQEAAAGDEAPQDEARAARLDLLAKANQRLARELRQARARTGELVEAVYRAALESFTLMEVPRPQPVRPDRRQATPEIAVAVLSDWQLGKRTSSYNSEVCAERIRLYAEKVVRLTELQRHDHPVRELRVWLLGDLIEGEDIFPGQPHVIDSGLYRQLVNGREILDTFLLTMLAHFERVHVVGVIGNHGAIGGRARREYDPETNMDRLLYRIVAGDFTLLKEDRITFNVPDGPHERNWYAVDRIGAYSALLAHGDQIRGGFAGFPFYGLAKKTWGWATGAVSEHFDEVVIGHWHQPTRQTLNRITARVNGSTESHNSYAQEQLAAVGRPSQTLLFVHPRRGVTAEYICWLDEPQEEPGVTHLRAVA